LPNEAFGVQRTLPEADHPLFDEITNNNRQAERTYVPHGYPGRVTLFLGKAPQALASLRSRRMPAELAAGGAEIYKIPGGHATILEEPRVRILAEQLRASIDHAIASARDSAAVPVAAGSLPAASS